LLVRIFGGSEEVGQKVIELWPDLTPATKTYLAKTVFKIFIDIAYEEWKNF
jgi:hypothetical protein